MGATIFFSFVLCLIQSSTQYSLGGLSHDVMVSDGWSDDILTDDWNGVPRGCSGKPADIYFVLDTAGGASPMTLARQKKYLNDLAALFPLRSSQTRVGIMTFGFAPFITTSLNKAPSLPLLQKAVADTPRVGGSRRTAQALKYLRQVAFSPSVVRPDVAHVVILLSDGYSSHSKQTAMESLTLRKQGVIVYTVSMSTSGHVDEQEVKKIASEPKEEFVFSAENWNIVGSLMEVLRIVECNYQVLPPLPGKEAVCVSRRPTEVAFAVEHLGLGTPKTQKIIAFIQNLLAEVDPESPIQAAILTSSDPINHHVLSTHVKPIHLLEQKLGGLKFPDISQLLKRAGKVLTREDPEDLEESVYHNAIFRSSRQRRHLKKNSHHHFRDVQKVLLVFLDKTVHLSKKSLAAAKANRNKKVDTYVVYMEGGEEREGEGLDMKEVEMLASGADHVIRVPGYDQLRYQETVVDTLKTVCRGL